LAMRAP